MSNERALSFNNVYVKDAVSPEEGFVISVYDDDMECLAEAKCETALMKDFLTDWLYPGVIEPEIEYFFYQELDDKEREIADKMNDEEFIQYLIDKLGESEVSTLNELYKIYVKLKKYINKNVLTAYSLCTKVKSIHSNYENTGAGTLIVDYLKNNCDLIFLYAQESSQGYWLDKMKFKEVINDFAYWSKDEYICETL